MIGWQQDYVCWKCRSRISCPPDISVLWSWPRSADVAAFEDKHRLCDDGKSVGLELLLIDMDIPEAEQQEPSRSIAVAGSGGGRGAAA